jgi:LacI family transcriptional regulator
MVSRGRRKSAGVVEMTRDLGVSTTTVARALNGSPSVRWEFADRTRAHTEAVGYVANRLARALSASTSRAFAGFVIPYVDTPAYSPSAHVLDDTRRLLAEIPVVELHRVSGIDAPSVFSDDEQALTDSILHLAELGHTEIAYLGTPRELSNGATRLRGIRRGVAQAGLDPRRITIRLVEPTQDNGRDATRELLAGDLRSAALRVAGCTGSPPGRQP